jgi:peptide/nickel transport system substrate-binding protein
VWSPDARPDGLPERIRVRVARDLRASATTAERDDFDIVEVADEFGPLLAPSAVRALAERHPDRILTTASPTLDFMWLNVHVPPLDDVRVRRALSYAVDRSAIVELEGGDTLARGACQFVAPGHPGYVPSCRYTRDPRPAGSWSGPDLGRARALIARSGTSGTRVTVWVPSNKRRIGRYFVRLLGRLGYESRLRVPGPYPEYHAFVADSDHRAQIGVDGWAADFPGPLDFTTPFRCDSYRPASAASINLAEFCGSGLERRIEAALSAGGPGADARWHAVYDALARAAPAVPLVNRRSAVLVSRRVGNFQHHPLFGVLLDQLWVADARRVG